MLMVKSSQGIITVVKNNRIIVSLAAIVLTIAGSLSLAVADTPPAPAPAGSTLDQRVAQRKAERGTVLSGTDQKRVVSTCTSAQTKIRAIETGEVSVLDNRTQVYGSIDA